MTTTFDIDEIERLLAAATPGDWHTDELDQGAQIWCGSYYIGETRDYTGDDAALIVTLRNSAATLIATARRVEVLERENARLRAGLTSINRKASPDPERTMSEASNDLYWCACEARAALGEPQ